ncbi:MAG TPA: hypothetical protein VKZ53_06120 [Candidatus Angelobacter sp.]|nr:hypothetical protein [Candidatus Angelobacter sp.]
MPKIAVFLLVTCLCAISQEQPAQWERSEHTDQLRGTSYSEFVLKGKFLTAPRNAVNDVPVLVLKCSAGGHHRADRGYTTGKFIDAYFAVQAVVDHESGRVRASYRLDNGKVRDTSWAVGTDGSAVFQSETELNTLLYGHWLPHRENTNPPIQKAVIEVNEYLAAKIVMQFDIPDPSDAADACGLIIHKK